jgi:hypothetical protein
VLSTSFLKMNNLLIKTQLAFYKYVIILRVLNRPIILIKVKKELKLKLMIYKLVLYFKSLISNFIKSSLILKLIELKYLFVSFT